jgi:multidrug efflux pump subunit AcrA (membrane-fusion protein)
MKGLIILLIINNLAFSTEKNIKEVFVQKAELQKISDIVIYPAEIKSKVYSEVKSQIDGIVDEIYVNLGETVKSNEKIIGLQNQESTLNFRKNITSSPVDGVIAKLLVRKGTFVSKGQSLFVITDPINSFVSVEVPVKDLDKIEIGKMGKLKVDFLDEEIEVKLIGKGNVVNKITGTVTCEFYIEGNRTLLQGVLGRVELDFDNSQKLLVSENAILFAGENKFIRKIENGKVKKYKIEIGRKSVGKVEVVSGLNPGEEYVSRSNGYLVDGDEVKIIKQ